ncbi:MAG: FliA/WhiG family RNA polymerase sigma factor [Firmicutes bacterium]|jgi:RNA polymerase sigma factor for flagellar operon FliA|nr:FliA/WhiG family RNA polymerase sigma factor [Bacillota bacterium]
MNRETVDLTDLWQQYKLNNDLAAREKLIEQYIPLVQYIAGRIAIHLPDNVEFNDLISYGIFGLMDAVDKFDLERDIKFETYASVRIRGGIMDGLRATDWIPRSVRTKAKQIDQTIMKLEHQFGRTPTDQEIAAALDMTLDKYHETVDQVRSIALLSLDDQITSDPDSESITLLDTLDDPTAAVDQELVDQETLQELAAAVDQLDERERLVVSLYYHEGLTLKEIGHVLEVSESRVSQIHSKAIRTLRTKLKFG